MAGLPEIPGYDPLERLGRGGSGEVILARRQGAHGIGQLVALKILHHGQREQAASRAAFLDEARLLARLRHPAVAQLVDFGESAGAPFLAMEYIAGIAFQDVRFGGGAIWPPDVAALALAEVCRGLQAAHSLTDLHDRPLGVVHRDICPQNLMLTYDGQVKIVDFGIALMRDRQAPGTLVGTAKGRLPYMAPEQVFGDPVDFRTDLFAAGVVFYELLTGVRPFRGSNPLEIGLAMKSGPPPPPSAAHRGVPAFFDAIVLRALEREPRARFASAKDMGNALAELAAAISGIELEEVLRKHLASERQQHLAWLRGLLGEGDAADDVERTQVDVTFGRPGADPEVAWVAAEVTSPGAPPEATAEIPLPSIPPHEAVTERETPWLEATVVNAVAPSRPSRRPLALLGAGAVALGVVAVLVLATRDDGELSAAGDIPEVGQADAAGLGVPGAAPAEPAPEEAPSPSGASLPVGASPREAQQLRQAVAAAMRTRGLLSGDSAELDQLRERMASAHKSGQADEELLAARAALAFVAALKVDDAFVAAKLRRLQDALSDPAAAANQPRAQTVLERVTAMRTLGDFAAANDELNRGFALLDARAPPRGRDAPRGKGDKGDLEALFSDEPETPTKAPAKKQTGVDALFE